MYHKACCTCKIVVLPESKPIAFLPLSLPSPTSLLKLPVLKMPWCELTCQTKQLLVLKVDKHQGSIYWELTDCAQSFLFSSLQILLI